MQIHDSTVLMAYQVRKKEVLVAYLLWWFFGPFGAHRFYCNRSGSAAAMLVIFLVSIPLTYLCVGFVGIAAVVVWWLVDAFSISAWVQEHNQSVMNQLEFARLQHESGSTAGALPMYAPSGVPLQSAARSQSSPPAAPLHSPAARQPAVRQPAAVAIRVDGHLLVPTCGIGGRLQLGSASYCAVRIEGAELAPLHGELERTGERSFRVRSINGAACRVACGRGSATLSEFRELGFGGADETEVDAPFVIDLGRSRVEVEVAGAPGAGG